MFKRFFYSSIDIFNSALKVFLSGYLQEFCLDKKILTPREPEKLSFAIKQAKVTLVAELGKRHSRKKKVGPVAKLDNPPQELPAQTSSASSSPCPPHQPGGGHDDDDGDYDDDGDNGGDDDDIDEGGLHPYVHLLSLQFR